MTTVDLAILAILAISGLLAFLRGFVREILGIGAWIGAAVLAIWASPYLAPRVLEWVPHRPGLARPIAFTLVFVVTLFVLLLLSHAIARLVRGSPLGGLDRTLGLVFGIVRGAALVVLAYIVLQVAVPVREWPTPMREARSIGLIYEGAAWAVKWLPPGYIELSKPPAGATPTIDALIRPVPQGRALGRPPARE